MMSGLVQDQWNIKICPLSGQLNLRTYGTKLIDQLNLSRFEVIQQMNAWYRNKESFKSVPSAFFGKRLNGNNTGLTKSYTEGFVYLIDEIIEV